MALSPARQEEIRIRLDGLRRSLAADELLWASGYMAGLAAADPAAVPAPEVEPGETLTIWYGTETGNARAIARRLAEAAEARGYTVDVANLGEIQPRRVGKLGLLLLIVSTHGEGDPPEQAERFYRFILSDRPARLDTLRYAVFALGDSSYPDFCQTGRELDERLAALGAHRLLERVDCDVDFETNENPWREQVLETVAPLLSASQPAAPAHLRVVRPEGPTIADHDRAHPFAAEVLERAPLTIAPSSKRVAHLELSLEGSGLSYQPGDSLGIWPRNDKRLVAEVIEYIGADPDSPVTRDDQERTLFNWLSEHLELTQVVRPFVSAWAELSGSDELAALLEQRDPLQAWGKTRQVPDVLREYPARVSPQQLVAALRRIAPRLYSIASSPLVAEDEVHLTVKLEGGEADGLLRAGSASWLVHSGTKAGDTLPVYVEANERFRLPEDADRPVIMIGPGTGVAPFRAFLQHRQALGHSGRNWLFFGEQHRRTDFLYQLEWQRFRRDGVLTDLSVAFSRDQAERRYVQHRLIEQGRAVHAWLAEGAQVYVCGNGQGMATDVHQALINIVARHGEVTPERAGEYLDELKQQRRYQKDVY